MRLLSLSLSLIFLSPLHATGVQPAEQLQVTQCLAAQLPSAYPVLAKNKQFIIISVPAADIDNIAHIADKARCGRFVNVTARLKTNTAKQILTEKPKLTKAAPVHYSLDHSAEVTETLNKVQLLRITKILTHLSDYRNRSATSQNGVKAASWLKSYFEDAAKTHKRKDTATFYVETGSGYKQPSLVTVLGKDIKEPAVVIGAHMDTLDGHMPGAGDDASGSAAVMEMAHVLMASHLPLKRPVYFIWYAAEERGLVGSQQVVKHFIDHKIPVKAAIQFDMAGFRNDRNDPTMWVYKDYTDPALSDFVARLMEVYLNVPVGYSECGYGCSDHASWMEENIPAAFPCETDFEHHNQAIHTPKDTMDRLTPEHVLNFSKLGVAFALELALD